MKTVRTAEITLDPHPASVGRARRWLSQQLEEWGLDDLDYDASVVLSELVTNAVLHAKTEIELTVSHDKSLRLEVRDSSASPPAARDAGASSSTGRGLHLVAALTTSWGFVPNDEGKVVWAEFGDVDMHNEPPGTSGSEPREASLHTISPRGGGGAGGSFLLRVS